METMTKKPIWIRFGIRGAIVAPAIMAVLGLSQGLFSYDSNAYQVLHLVAYYGSWPILVCIEKGLYAIGIYGDQGLVYIVPIFAVILLYWAVIGFAAGAIVAIGRGNGHDFMKLLAF